MAKIQIKSDKLTSFGEYFNKTLLSIVNKYKMGLSNDRQSHFCF